MKINISKFNLPKINISNIHLPKINISKKGTKGILAACALVMAFGVFGFTISNTHAVQSTVQAENEVPQINWADAIEQEFYMPVEKASLNANDGAENREAILSQIYPETQQCDIQKHRQNAKTGTVAMFDGSSECM